MFKFENYFQLKNNSPTTRTKELYYKIITCTYYLHVFNKFKIVY